MVDRLHRMFQQLLAAGRERIQETQHDLFTLNLIHMIKQRLATVPHLSKRLEGRMRVLLAQHRHRIHAKLTQLNTLSPLAILGRGYCILQTVPAGQVLHRASDVGIGQELEAQLASGRLICTVTQVFDDSSV
jgi:exodeoxyribonuclease VII large subunit